MPCSKKLISRTHMWLIGSHALNFCWWCCYACTVDVSSSAACWRTKNSCWFHRQPPFLFCSPWAVFSFRCLDVVYFWKPEIHLIYVMYFIQLHDSNWQQKIFDRSVFMPIIWSFSIGRLSVLITTPFTMANDVPNWNCALHSSLDLPIKP